MSSAKSSTSGLAPSDKRQLREQGSFYFARVLDIAPFDYQAEFIDGDSKRKQLCCGRQVGKTEICAGAGLHDATTNDDHTVLIVAPTQRQSSNLFKRLKSMMADSPIEDWGVERRTQTIIEFSNGSRIICLPAGTDGSTIRGYTADCIIVDEAAFVPDEVFSSVLNPMLATTDGTMILASTPFGTAGFFYESSISERWQTLQVPTAESPLVDESFLEQQRDELTDIEFRQEMLGEFVESAGAYLPRTIVRPCVAGNITRAADSDAFLGVDVARKGGDRTVYTGLDQEGNVFLLESEDTSTVSGVVGRIKALDETHGFSGILIDENAVGGGVVDFSEAAPEVGRKTIAVTFSTKTKQAMYRGLKNAFESEALQLPNHRRLVHELTSLTFDFTQHGKLRVEHPPGGHDDFPDSLALSHFGLMKSGRQSTSNNSGVRSF